MTSTAQAVASASSTYDRISPDTYSKSSVNRSRAPSVRTSSKSISAGHRGNRASWPKSNQCCCGKRFLFFAIRNSRRAEHVAFARCFGDLERTTTVAGSDPDHPVSLRIYKCLMRRMTL